MKVVMLGADRSVKGGVSAVVNNLYEAGLDQRIDLTGSISRHLPIVQ